MNSWINYLLVKVLILTIILPTTSYGQSDGVPISSQEVFNHFDKLFQIDSRAAGHPFFISPDWKSGSVAMEGIVFNNLQMRYDISSDLVILNTAGFTNSAVQLVLKKDRIEYFTLNGNLFQPYPEDDPMTGIRFCQVLEEGTVDFLLIRSKNLKVTTTGLSDFAYQTKQSRILRVNDELHPFMSRRSLIRMYPGFKSELREYLKESQLRFKRMSLNDHTGFVKYCNSLIGGNQ